MFSYGAHRCVEIHGSGNGTSTDGSRVPGIPKGKGYEIPRKWSVFHINQRKNHPKNLTWRSLENDLIFDGRYIFKFSCFSIVMLGFWGCNFCCKKNGSTSEHGRNKK